MNKYEYTSALKFQYLAEDRFLEKLEQLELQKANELNLKNKVVELIKYLRKIKEFLDELCELKNVHNNKQKNGNNNKDIEIIEAPSIKAGILREVGVSKKEALFTQLNIEAQCAFLRLVVQAKAVIEGKKVKEGNVAEEGALDLLKREHSKSQASRAGVLDVLRLVKQHPKIQFSNKKAMSLLDFLLLLADNLKLTQSKLWITATETIRKLDVEVLNLFTLLQDKKELLRASFNYFTITKSYTPEELKVELKELSKKRQKQLDLYEPKKGEKLISPEEFKEILRNVSYAVWANKNSYHTELSKVSLAESAILLRKFYKNNLRRNFDNALNEFFESFEKDNSDLDNDKELKKLLKEEWELKFQTDQDFAQMIGVGVIWKDGNCLINNNFSDFLLSKFKAWELKSRLNSLKQQLNEVGGIVKEVEQSEKLQEQIGELNIEYQSLAQKAGVKYTNLLRKCKGEFIEYKNKIAQENGKLITQEKSLDNARYFLSHWALLGFPKGKEFDFKKTYVVFIPKKQANWFDKQVSILESQTDIRSADFTLIKLHSLTLSALKNKLVAKNIPGIIPYLNKEECKEQEIVKVFKLVLKKIYGICVNSKLYIDKKAYNIILRSKFNKKTMELPPELKVKLQRLLEFDHTTLEEFRKDLESDFYYLEKIFVKKDELAQLLQNINKKADDSDTQDSIYKAQHYAYFGKITGYDFKRNINYTKRFTEDFKELMRNLDEGLISKQRLNPELALYFTPKQDIVSHKENRRAKSRLHIHFVYTKNQPGKQFNPRFSDDEEIKRQLEEFNDSINDKIQKSNKYLRVGIDIGTNELVSVAFFNRWKDGRDIKKDGFPVHELTFYRINQYDAKGYKCFKKECLDEELKEIVLYKNPSFFLHKDEKIRAFKEQSLSSDKVTPNDYLEKIKSWHFDLTAAKLVGDKVIINANISTYLKLRFIEYQKKIVRNSF